MFFHYFSNKAMTRGRSIVVQVIEIKTSLFDHRCDKSRFETLWEDARYKRIIELNNERMENEV